jgi:hypothetical protein
MTSFRQIEANDRNARKSTGSKEGTQQSRQCDPPWVEIRDSILQELFPSVAASSYQGRFERAGDFEVRGIVDMVGLEQIVTVTIAESAISQTQSCWPMALAA